MSAPETRIEDYQSAEGRMRAKLGDYMNKGCIVSIEHAPAVRPRYTRWELWAKPDCYNGDLAWINTEIDRCRAAHSDHVIRLVVEDFSVHSRMSLVVHRPELAIAA